MFFSLTKNKYISFGLTVIVVVLFLTLYNKDSQYFILDEPLVTEVEILNAKKVLEKANSEREKKYDKKAAEFEKNVCNYGAVWWYTVYVVELVVFVMFPTEFSLITVSL